MDLSALVLNCTLAPRAPDSSAPFLIGNPQPVWAGAIWVISPSMAGRTATEQSAGAFCPHCHLLVEPGAEQPWPAAPVRCPHCQLLIGTGRARSEPSGEPGAKGTAAGVFSRQARRDEGEDRASAQEVLEAIVVVAEEAGERPERLLMVDYQQRSITDPDLPPLADVLDAFGSWKRARREASELAPPSAG